MTTATPSTAYQTPHQQLAAKAVRAFGCELCGAAPGDACRVRGTDTPLKSPHSKRIGLYYEHFPYQSPPGGVIRAEVTTGTRISRRELLEEVDEITDVVGLNDLTTSEIASLVELLRPAYTDVLARQHMPPVLRLVRDDPIDE
jgi:hypothetical protein